jgi:hypothetical protein
VPSRPPSLDAMVRPSSISAAPVEFARLRLARSGAPAPGCASSAGGYHAVSTRLPMFMTRPGSGRPSIRCGDRAFATGLIFGGVWLPASTFVNPGWRRLARPSGAGEDELDDAGRGAEREDGVLAAPGDVTQRACYTLAVLEDLSSQPGPRGILRQPAADGTRGAVFMSILFDPPCFPRGSPGRPWTPRPVASSRLRSEG